MGGIFKLVIIIQTRYANALNKSHKCQHQHLFELMNCEHFPRWWTDELYMLQLKETLEMGLSLPTPSFLIYWSFEVVNDLSR